jgi:hypothetical protein
MRYAAVHIAILRQPPALLADDSVIGAWVRLIAYASEHELGDFDAAGEFIEARIEGARAWTDRQWGAAINTDLEGVESTIKAGMARWDGQDLLVFGYNLASQKSYDASRTNGKKGGRPPKPKPDGQPKDEPVAEPRGYPDDKPIDPPVPKHLALLGLDQLNLAQQDPPKPPKGRKRAENPVILSSSAQAAWDAYHPRRGCKREEFASAWESERCQLHVEAILAALAQWRQSERWIKGDAVVAAHRWLQRRAWEEPAPPPPRVNATNNPRVGRLAAETAVHTDDEITDDDMVAAIEAASR